MPHQHLNQIPASSGAKMTWQEDIGGHKIWGGASLVADCEPHFHDTYSIVHITNGTIVMMVEGRRYPLQAGDVVLGNPYEVVSAHGARNFEYDACYPTQGFLQTLVRSLGLSSATPRFASAVLQGELGAEVGAVVSDNRRAVANRQAFPLEERLARVFARHPEILASAPAEGSGVDCVDKAFALFDSLLDQPFRVSDVCKRLDASRSHFVRTFSSAVGLPPSRYIRQLRLARGLERILDGTGLADAAAASGFADQAHFTREFKRVYGATPGMIMRTRRQPA